MDHMETVYASFDDDGIGRVLIELAKAYTPRDTIREYLTNGLDARLQGQREQISVLLDPRDRRIIISDNGIGIHPNILRAMPRKLGNSLKFGKVGYRGEKGLGILAFASIGEALHIVTRPNFEASENYGYLRWEIDKKQEKVPVAVGELTTRQVENEFYGIFAHGTRIVIDRVDPDIMTRALTIGNLQEWLTMLYNPAIKKGIVDIKIGKYDRKRTKLKTATLEPINFETSSSTKYMDETLDIEIKGEKKSGKLEVLLYVDAEAVANKVAVYSKDVLVYESIAAIEALKDISKSPVWTSGKVVGYFNDHFSKLILGRTGMDMQCNAFKAWYSKIKELEKSLLPFVEESKKRGKRAIENKHIRKAYEALSDVWKELGYIGRGLWTRNKNGIELNVEGVSPEGEIGIPIETEEETEKGNKSNHAGPGVFEENGIGTKETVSRRKGGEIPFKFVEPLDFPVSQKYFRSRLEQQLGSPKVYINSSHDDYLSRVSLKDSKIFLRYIVELMTKEGAFFEITKAREDGKLPGSEIEVLQYLQRREEEARYRTLKRLGII